MGNCLETCSESWRGEEVTATNQVQFEEDGDDRQVPKGGGFNGLGGCSEDDDGNKGVMRVKIVLTRQELEWLMLQLNSGGSNNSRGGVDSKKRYLEEVLGEIERGRSWSRAPAAATAWRPSLESIMEFPEVPARMDRS